MLPPEAGSRTDRAAENLDAPLPASAAANVALVEGERPASCYAELPEMDLGFMLYDTDYEHGCAPLFFHAVMRRGEIVPEAEV